MYSFLITIYFPATSKLKNIIKLVVYSTLKSKLMPFFCHHLDFLHSFPFHQPSSPKPNKASHLLLEPRIPLPVPY